MKQAPSGENVERDERSLDRAEPRGVGIVVALGLAMLAVACPNPEGKLDEFLENTKELRDLPFPKEDVGGSLEDVSGTFLMAVASAIDPMKPLQFTVEQTFRPDGAGGFLDMTLQPLALDLQSVDSPRTPVGDGITLTDIPVSEDGKYIVPSADTFQQFMVTGAANPITGSDIVTELRYLGTIQSENFLCGTIEGNLVEPLQADLMGSTFAVIRIDSTDPATLPVPFVDFTPDCSGVDSGDSGGSSTGSDSDSGGSSTG